MRCISGVSDAVGLFGVGYAVSLFMVATLS